MNRRGFFKLFGLGVAGIALEQAIPLGRVWSFPTEIIPKPTQFTGGQWIDAGWGFADEGVLTVWEERKGIHWIKSIDRLPGLS